MSSAVRTVRTVLALVTGRVTDEERVLSRELADCTAAERTELTLIAADAPAGEHVVQILRAQAERRLLSVG